MKPTAQKVTHLIRQTINQVDDKAEVILFGSRARGEERKDSDILVLTDYPVNPAIERNFRYALCDLELETAESFSLFVYSKIEWTTKHRITPFYNSISQEGVREKQAYAQYRLEAANKALIAARACAELGRCLHSPRSKLT